jgi:hypothetical protein
MNYHKSTFLKTNFQHLYTSFSEVKIILSWPFSIKYLYTNIHILREISGSHGGKYEDDYLLECCAL